jgi:hypothetical protein
MSAFDCELEAMQISLAKWCLIGVIMLVAIGVRVWDLGTHFSHVDDLGVARTLITLQQNPEYDKPSLLSELHESRWSLYGRLGHSLAVKLDNAGLLDALVPAANKLVRIQRFSEHWTYAPLQFLITDSMVSDTRTYRENLFWGRVPSLLFSIAALILCLFIYQRSNMPGVLPAFLLVALSWEHTIYAKQQESYAIAVFATTAVILLVLQHTRAQRLSLTLIGSSVLVLSILSYAQYQTLFLVPAFFLATFLHHWREEGRVRLVAVYSVASACLVGLVAPLYFLFIRQHQNRGIHWNGGPDREFVFSLESMDSSLDAILFFIKNTFVVLHAMVALVPERSWLYLPFGLLFFVLFVSGIVAFSRNPDSRYRTLGLFMLVVAITWVGLLVSKIIALSPTRHSLILLPIFAIILAEGLHFWQLKAEQMTSRAMPWLPFAACGVLLLPFGYYLPGIIAERDDPFNEQRIVALTKQHEVTMIIAADWTHNLGLMRPWSRDSVYFQDLHFVPGNDDSIAYVSHRQPLNAVTFEHARTGISDYYQQQHLAQQDRTPKLAGLDRYDIVFTQQQAATPEVDFSNLTQNGGNGYYFYVLKKKVSKEGLKKKPIAGEPALVNEPVLRETSVGQPQGSNP